MSLDEHLEEIVRKVIREELHTAPVVELEGLLTADRVAELLDCDRQTVYRLRRENHLKAVFTGETTFKFAPEEVRRFIKVGGIQALSRKQDAA